jgi:hypothetical protein
MLRFIQHLKSIGLGLAVAPLAQCQRSKHGIQILSY